MEPITIELTFRSKDFREIYYVDQRKNIFTWPHTKKPIIILSCLVALSVFNYIGLKNSKSPEWIFLFVIFLIVDFSVFVRLLLNTARYSQWKMGVEVYLRDLSKHPNHTLVLSDEIFELNKGDEKFIARWSGVNHVSILPNHILLKLDDQTQYIFPEKSMKSEDYELLKGFIQSKISSKTS